VASIYGIKGTQIFKGKKWSVKIIHNNTVKR
jgi:hypothetical protein